MTSEYSILIASAVAYLLGSIPSAVWYGKSVHGIDVREHGSGNAGATNTLRTLGKKAGFIVLGIDFLKGFAAASLVLWLGELQPGTSTYINYQMLFGMLAVVGHMYPVFAKFKGGKGIATLIGVITAMDYQLALLCFIAFFIIVYFTRFISLGSMIAASMSPLFVILLHRGEHPSFIAFCVVIALLVIYTHRTNIKRLRDGNENKFSFNKKPATSS